MYSGVYIIQLANKKFYVGYSHNIYTTLKQLFSRSVKNKDPWVLHHKPLYVHRIIRECDPDDEHKYLVEYIRRFGVENVRGGTFDATVYENESLREVLKKTLTDNKVNEYNQDIIQDMIKKVSLNDKNIHNIYYESNNITNVESSNIDTNLNTN